MPRVLDFLDEEEYDAWHEKQRQKKLDQASKPAQEASPWQQAWSAPPPTPAPFGPMPAPFGPMPAPYGPMPAPFGPMRDPNQPTARPPSAPYDPMLDPERQPAMPPPVAQPPMPETPTPWQQAWQNRTQQADEGRWQEDQRQREAEEAARRQQWGTMDWWQRREVPTDLTSGEDLKLAAGNLAGVVGTGFDAINRTALENAINVGDFNPLSPRAGQKWTDPKGYSQAVRKASGEGWTPLLPEGPVRGAAGAVGDALWKGITGQGMTEEQAALMIDPTNPQSAKRYVETQPERQPQAQADWERWQHEKTNPLVEGLGAFVDPTNLIGVGEAKAMGKAAAPLLGKAARAYVDLANKLPAPGLSIKDVTKRPLETSAVNTPRFQQWFSDSKVVDESGAPLVVYRGDYRADKLGDKFKVNKATSGRFYFTENPEVASNYSLNKPDVHVQEELQDFENWFQFPPDKGARTPNNLQTVWYRLSPEQKARVKDVMLKAGQDENGNWDFSGANNVVGEDHWNWEVKQARGNWLMAAKEVWLNSANLFNEEEQFVDLLRAAGLKDVKFDSPHMPGHGVTPVYLNIRNPLDTSNIPAEVVDRLRQVAKSDRTRGSQFKYDMWDKSTNAKVFMERLENDLREGTTYAWTQMPEKITQAIQAMGYDGIKDTGGKLGGQKHGVWIAFEPTQIKSVFNKGKWSPDNANMLGQASIGTSLDLGSSAVGGAAGYATADENATEEERLARAAMGAAGGFGVARAARTGRIGLGIEDVSKGKVSEWLQTDMAARYRFSLKNKNYETNEMQPLVFTRKVDAQAAIDGLLDEEKIRAAVIATGKGAERRFWVVDAERAAKELPELTAADAVPTPKPVEAAPAASEATASVQTIEQAYDAALLAARQASKDFRAIQQAYRAKQIDDAAFLAGKAEFDKAQAAMDAAETRFIDAKNAEVPTAELTGAAAKGKEPIVRFEDLPVRLELGQELSGAKGKLKPKVGVATREYVARLEDGTPVDRFTLVQWEYGQNWMPSLSDTMSQSKRALRQEAADWLNATDPNAAKYAKTGEAPPVAAPAAPEVRTVGAPAAPPTPFEELRARGQQLQAKYKALEQNGPNPRDFRLGDTAGLDAARAKWTAELDQLKREMEATAKARNAARQTPDKAPEPVAPSTTPTIAHEQAIASTEEPTAAIRKDLLPAEWSIKVTGQASPLAEVDWGNKVIRVASEEIARNPSAMNHEISHLLVERLPWKTTRREFYKDLGISQERITDGLALEDATERLGQYLTHPEDNLPDAAIMEKYFPAIKAPEPPVQASAAAERVTPPAMAKVAPEGTRYDPNLKPEAQAYADGSIAVGPKFFDLSEAARQQVLAHERAHVSGLESAAFDDPEFWRLVQQENMFGPINPVNGEITRGINGQFKPGENVVEGYAVLMSEPAWLKQEYPKAYGYIGDLAQKRGLPVPDEWIRDRGSITPPAAEVPLPASTATNAVPPPPAAKPPVPAGAGTQGTLVPATPTAALPRDLAGAKPRYKLQVLTFENDVDKALYIVGNEATRSKRDGDYLKFLQSALPDRSEKELRQMGRVVRGYVGRTASGTIDTPFNVKHSRVQKYLTEAQSTPAAKPPPKSAATSKATSTSAGRPPVWAEGADTSILSKGQRGTPTGVRIHQPTPPVPTQGPPPTLPSGRTPGGMGGQTPPPPIDPYQMLQDALTPDRKPLGQRAVDTGRAFMRDAYDRNWDLGKLEKETGIPVHKLAQVVSGAVGAGENRVRRFVLPIIEPLGKDTKYLEQYMVNMRNADILARNPHALLEGNIPGWGGVLTIEKQLKAQLGAERFAAVQDAAKGLWEVNRRWILEPLRDAGMLSDEALRDITSAHPHYVDFHRADFSITDGIERVMTRPEASVADINIKKMQVEGSGRKLDQPLARTEAQITRTRVLISRNEAAKAIVAALMEREKTAGETLVKALKPSEAAEHSNITDTISFFHKGKKVIVQVPPVFAAIAKGLEGETSNTLLNIVKATSAPLRMGAVNYNPAFVLANPVRDAVSALFRERLIPLSPEYLRGWIAAITKNADFTDAAEAGVLMSGIVDNFRSTEALSRAANVGRIPVNDWKDVLAYVPRLIERVNLVSEQSTRIATYHKLRGQGLSGLDAAIRARDVTVDFAKAGNVMKTVNQVIPFANAGVQGAANTIRLIKDNPKQALLASSALAMPTIMAYLWNQRFETGKMIPEYEYANNWVLQVGEGEKKSDPKYPNKPGEKFPVYFKIPKGPLGAFVTAPIEMLLRVALAKDDRSVVEHLLEGVGTMARAISPIDPSVSGILPPVFSTPIGVALNRDPYTLREIVPQKEANRPAELRYGPENTREAIALGERFHVSPRLIDWAIRDYAAGVGQQASWLADVALGALGYNPGVMGEAKRQGLSDTEQLARLPIVSRFVGTKNNEQESAAWDRFNQAVEDSQRAFAEMPEMRRLGISLGPVGDSISLKPGVSIALTPEERAGLQKETSEMIIRVTNQVIRDARYEKLTDIEKQKALQTAMNKSREAARNDFLRQFKPDELKRRAIEAYPVRVAP